MATDDQIRALLDGLDERLKPTADERTRAESRMWAELDALEGSGGREEGGSSSIGTAELVRLDDPPVDRKPRWLLAVAAILVVVLGVGVLVERTREAVPDDRSSTSPVQGSGPAASPSSEPPPTPLPTSGTPLGMPPGRYTAILDDIELQFDLATDAVLVESAPDLVRLATDADLGDESVVIAVTEPIFDRDDPSSWFADRGVGLSELGRVVQGERAAEWQMQLEDGSCELPGACLPIAQTTVEGSEVSLVEGGTNRLLTFDRADGRAVVILGVFPDIPTGETFDLYNGIANSIGA